MKTLLFLLLCGMTFCLPFKQKPVSSETTTSTVTDTDTVSFVAQIQPILQTRCNPCHFPGGKMYEKMPFDQAQTILDHPESILKRINDAEENRLLKQFFAQREM